MSLLRLSAFSLLVIHDRVDFARVVLLHSSYFSFVCIDFLLAFLKSFFFFLGFLGPLVSPVDLGGVSERLSAMLFLAHLVTTLEQGAVHEEGQQDPAVQDEDCPNVRKNDRCGHFVVPADSDQADEARHQNWKVVSHHDIDK